MNRIDVKFKYLGEIGRKALIPFITIGNPDIETTKTFVCEMEANGADLIELGIPYSDPIAEGPVIQEANKRALANGIKMADCMSLVSEIRKTTEIPLLFLLYFNCILQYGIDGFFSDCVASGVDGVIIPDLPYEERDEIADSAHRNGVHIISLIAPTSENRVRMLAQSAEGFIYCVSSLGVTGIRNGFDTDFQKFFDEINKYSKIPKALGFGISTPEHAAMLKHYCDGLIVGSAIVKKINDSADPKSVIKNVDNFVISLRKAMDD
jgi:tryptophan synthase alpha chain